MKTNVKQKLVFSGLFLLSISAAVLSYEFGDAARSYLDASADPVEAVAPVARRYEDLLGQVMQGKRVEVHREIKGKTHVKVYEGSLQISPPERRLLHATLKRMAKSRRKDYEAYVTKLVTKDEVTMADLEREALMSHGALRAEFELELFEKGEFIILDDSDMKPLIPKGWNWTRYNRMYRINDQWRAMVTLYDPRKSPRLENEYRRYTQLADGSLDQWARNFNQKTVSERRTFIQGQQKIAQRIQAMLRIDKSNPEIMREWVSLWREKSPQGIRFDEASWYAMLQQ